MYMYALEKTLASWRKASFSLESIVNSAIVFEWNKMIIFEYWCLYHVPTYRMWFGSCMNWCTRRLLAPKLNYNSPGEKWRFAWPSGSIVDDFLGSANNCIMLIDRSLALNCDHVFHSFSRLSQSSRYDPGLLWPDFASRLHFELAMNDCCVPNCYALPNTDRICFFPMIWQEQAAWIVDWWVYQTSGRYLPTCKCFFLLLSMFVNT